MNNQKTNNLGTKVKQKSARLKPDALIGWAKILCAWGISDGKPGRLFYQTVQNYTSCWDCANHQCSVMAWIIVRMAGVPIRSPNTAPSILSFLVFVIPFHG